MAKKKRLTKKQRNKLRALKAARTKREMRDLEIMSKISEMLRKGMNAIEIALNLKMKLKDVKRYIKRIERVEDELKPKEIKENEEISITA